MKDITPVFIDTPEKLEVLCQQLAGQPWLTLDTEFMRESTYYPELCLLQIATPELIACIDPLALDSLEPLLDILYDQDILKILHASHQDLEIFFHLRGTVPAPVFDTQLAAPLLGYPQQAGYAILVQQVLGIPLGKGHARTDWSQRPLSPAQLRYAADDVRYLVELYLALRQQLEQHGRLDWLTQDFAQLAEASRYQVEPEQAWKKIRSAARLQGRALAILQALAAWREQTARQQNKPRSRILRDDALTDLARLAPATQAELNQIRSLHQRSQTSYGAQLLEIIQQAGSLPPPTQNQKKIPRKISSTQETVVTLLEVIIQHLGQINDINPQTLATRKELEQWLLSPDDSVLNQGWRGKLIGQHLHDAFDGRLALQISQGELHLITVD